MGNTPIQLNLASKHTYNIEFRKDGYDNRTVVVNASVGGGWVVLDISADFFPSSSMLQRGTGTVSTRIT